MKWIYVLWLFALGLVGYGAYWLFEHYTRAGQLDTLDSENGLADGTEIPVGDVGGLPASIVGNIGGLIGLGGTATL